MGDKYVTVTGFSFYKGTGPFRIGNLIRCEKEPKNYHDAEAIKCTLPMIGTVGYVANSTGTVALGTMSAGRIYDQVSSKFYVRVMFITNSKIICRVEDSAEPNELKTELLSQLDDEWDKDDGDDDDDDWDEEDEEDDESEEDEPEDIT